MSRNSKIVFDKLLNSKQTISFCESATGGMLSSIMCGYENASKVFVGSFITYASFTKQKVLNIDPKIIAKYGVVSSQIAYLMVKNTQSIFKSDICVSITGNASQVNTLENKQTCLYYIGFYIKSKIKIFCVQLQPLGNRNFNRLAIANWIFNKLLSLI